MVEPGLRIGLALDVPDWHARELSRALAAAGARAVPFRLAAASFETGAASGLRLPGFGEALPDAVVVRAVSAGTFEAVTVRLGILHALREQGVPVWNDARAIERCVDKSMTSFLLAQAGIPTPATWTVASQADACAVVRREAASGPLVSKPLFGSQGRGLKLIRSIDDLPPIEAVGGVHYLQRFAGTEQDGFRDLRLLVSAGRIVTAMLRHADGWITNIKRGGRPIAAVADAEMTDLALRAAAAVGADLAGVDILRDAAGHARVIEVNSMPAWHGLQKVTNGNIAAIIVGDLLAALPARSQRRTAM